MSSDGWELYISTPQALREAASAGAAAAADEDSGVSSGGECSDRLLVLYDKTRTIS